MGEDRRSQVNADDGPGLPKARIAMWIAMSLLILLLGGWIASYREGAEGFWVDGTDAGLLLRSYHGRAGFMWIHNIPADGEEASSATDLPGSDIGVIGTSDGV